MLQSTINGNKWKKDAMKKLTSFADKCPLLLTVSTGIYKGIDGVFIKVSGSEHKYFFKFEIGTDIKKFIYGIKMKLLPEYPRLIEKRYDEHPATPVDIAKQLEQGIPLQSVNKVVRTYLGCRVWRIEKVFSWNEIFFLYPEQTTDGENKVIPDQAQQQYRFKYNGSSILFLHKYRTNGFSSIEEASEDFFKNSNLINTVNVKND